MQAQVTANTEGNKSFEDFEKEFKAKEVRAMAWAKKNGFEVSNIKVFLAGSEETLCFVANVKKDGKVVGRAENQGHGGSTFVDIIKGLSPEESEYLEIFVDAKVNESANEKELKSMINKASRQAEKRGCKLLAYQSKRGTFSHIACPHDNVEAFKKELAARGEGEFTVVKLNPPSVDVLRHFEIESLRKKYSKTAYRALGISWGEGIAWNGIAFAHTDETKIKAAMEAKGYTSHQIIIF
jgi:energy-coupling factor transporter ATP-binding protein EcfA2